MNSLKIRRGEKADIALLAAFNRANALESEALFLNEEASIAGVTAVVEDPTKGIYYLAVDGDRVVGSLLITKEWSDWRACWKWWLQSVYVVPAFRGKGVFDSLCSFVEEEASKEGVPSLSLYMEHNNERARKAYLKNSFLQSHYVMLEKELSVKK